MRPTWVASLPHSITSIKISVNKLTTLLNATLNDGEITIVNISFQQATWLRTLSWALFSTNDCLLAT